MLFRDIRRNIVFPIRVFSVHSFWCSFDDLTNVFVIFIYFSLISLGLCDNKIEDKPEQIWQWSASDLVEQFFCHFVENLHINAKFFSIIFLDLQRISNIFPFSLSFYVFILSFSLKPFFHSIPNSVLSESRYILKCKRKKIHVYLVKQSFNIFLLWNSIFFLHPNQYFYLLLVKAHRQLSQMFTELQTQNYAKYFR